MIRFAIHVGSRRDPLAIVGFRTLDFKILPGKGDNVPRDGEVRIAPQLIAVFGQPSKLQWTSDRRESAKYVADAIPKARVVAVKVTETKKEKRAKS